jgi:hypothetical protein
MNIAFPYHHIDRHIAMPLIPIRLEALGQFADVTALIDSGAAASVLPYQIGLALDLDWDIYPAGPALGGTIQSTETRMVVLDCDLEGFGTVELGFVWSKARSPRVLLGQTNFFQKFNICFFRMKDKIVISNVTGDVT